MSMFRLRCSFFLLLLAVHAFATSRAGAQQVSPTPSRSFQDEVNAYIPPKVDRHSPETLLAGLKDSQEGYLQEQALYKRDAALEAALARGEHPTLPTNYAASASHLPSLKEWTMSIRHWLKMIEEVLHSPKAATLKAEDKRALEWAVAHELAIKPPAREPAR